MPTTMTQPRRPRRYLGVFRTADGDLFESFDTFDEGVGYGKGLGPNCPKFWLYDFDHSEGKARMPLVAHGYIAAGGSPHVLIDHRQDLVVLNGQSYPSMHEVLVVCDRGEPGMVVGLRGCPTRVFSEVHEVCREAADVSGKTAWAIDLVSGQRIAEANPGDPALPVA